MNCKVDEEVVKEIGKFFTLWNRFEATFFNCDFKPGLLDSKASGIPFGNNEVDKLRSEIKNRIDLNVKDYVEKNYTQKNQNQIVCRI